ncbi:MAG: EamA family transporter RarD, partial [Clostridiales bacterium]|nr:EamA family transporter RarD [Clostridiales bacterium]
MEKKRVMSALSCYVIWGIQPLYLGLMTHINPMLTLALRIFWAAAFALGILAFTHRLPELKALFLNRQKMKFLAPAMLFLLGDWGVFIYAVETGHVLDTSLGYYMAPFVVFALGMIIFKEKLTPLMIAAMLLAFSGVAVSVLQYGQFPLISVVLSFLFAIYGALKKTVQVESVLSISAETIMMLPLTVAFMFVSSMWPALAASPAGDHFLFIGAGIITALPMMLYTFGVVKLPYVMIGFMQYIAPTLSLCCGLLMGETVTPDKLVTFLFIWAALAL